MEATIKKVLVPIDFSDYSKSALKYAVNFSKLFNAEIILIYVVEPVIYPLDFSMGQIAIPSFGTEWDARAKEELDKLAKKLAELSDDETLIVASSDLSHFYSKSHADRLDSIVEKRIREFDFNNLQTDLDTHVCEACGGGPIVALMKSADLKNVRHSLVLNRSDSGDVTGDNKEVVGYLSAVFYGD